MTQKKRNQGNLKALGLLLIILFAIMVLLAMQLGGKSENKGEISESLKNTESKKDTERLSSEDTQIPQDVQQVLQNGFFKVTEEAEQFEKKQDGMTYFKGNITTLQVQNKDNSEVAEAVNTVLREQKEENKNALEVTGEDALFYMEQYVETEGVASFQPYTRADSYKLLRNDERVFSFIKYTSVYQGGNHGDVLVYCMNFDASTGKLLTLTHLLDTDSGVSKEAFLSAIQDEILKQCQEMEVTFFDGYEQLIPSLLETEGTFALTADGLQIVAQPYVLGPYSSGMMVFTIPTEKLQGFMEDYQYQD